MPGKRILHIVHGYPPESGGGTEAYVQSLIRSQCDLGLEAMLLHGSFEPRKAPRIEAREDLPHPAWRLHRADTYADFWDRAHDPGAGRILREFLGKVEPDLVHVHQWIRLTDDLVEISEGLGIPTLVSLHDLYSSCPACFRLRPDESHCERVVSFEDCGDCVPLRGQEGESEVRLGIELYRDNFRHELSRARKVLAATHATARLVTRGLSLPENLVEILPLGHEPRFEGPSSFSLPGRGETLRLAFWGLLTHRKGVGTLLRALQEIGGGTPPGRTWELHVFGRVDAPDLEKELCGLARGLPVSFHGPYEYAEIARLRPHLAVFPSLCFETYGFVLDEAFELGIPALVTEVGALAERLGGGGFLVPPKDPSAMAAVLGRILEDPTLLEERRRGIPPPPPTPPEHARALLRLYAEARARAPGEGLPPPPGRRLELETLRRFHATRSPPDRRGLRSG